MSDIKILDLPWGWTWGGGIALGALLIGWGLLWLCARLNIRWVKRLLIGEMVVTLVSSLAFVGIRHSLFPLPEALSQQVYLTVPFFLWGVLVLTALVLTLLSHVMKQQAWLAVTLVFGWLAGFAVIQSWRI